MNPPPPKKKKNLGLPSIPCRKTSLGVFYLQNDYAGIRGPHHSQKYLLISNHQKKILCKFAFPNKNRRIEDFKPKKIPRSSPHLKSATPPPQPPASARPLGGKERVRLDGEVGVMVPTDIEQKHMASSWFMTGAR